MKPVLKSRWRGELEEFLKFRRTNFTTDWPAAKLRRSDQFAAEHADLQLPEAIAAWLKRNPTRHPSTVAYDLVAIRQFCRYRRRFDPTGFVPESLAPVPSIRSHFHPQILSRSQVKMLLQNVGELAGPPLRRSRMRALLLVLYCTGLRIGEALRLRLIDFDLRQRCFRIGPSKGRVRLVPFGQDLAAELEHYLNCRRRAGFRLAPQTTLFEREDGRADNIGNARKRFYTLFRRCGLRPKRGSGKGTLRVHDLRHHSECRIIPSGA